MLEVSIDKLVHGGQGIGTLADGKKALVWNTLSGETVRFTPRKTKSSFVEGVAEEILVASPARVVPRDELYLSTSPWQMMNYQTENDAKQSILSESLQRAGVTYKAPIDFTAPAEPWHYRNKMEYSFYGDEDGLHLALFNRGTHRKQIVTGSSIARPEIDVAAGKIRDILAMHNLRAGDLKSVIVRCNQVGQCVVAIFTRNDRFPRLPELAKVCKGVAVYFSNPKSPASIVTRELYTYGDTTLEDIILGRSMRYNVVSFFQGNLDAYSLALQEIRDAVGETQVTDMYSGVGSIGLSVATTAPRLVELDPHSVAMARTNALASNFDNVEVIESATEKATDYIPSGAGQTVIFDPPRAGLHARVIETVLQKLPSQVVYLSCNPSTFARDLELLQGSYVIESVSGYNFFPRTPHIEALAVLTAR